MTAKRWTADQKLEVVLARLRNEGSTAELCRQHGISHSTFNKWHRLFIVRSASRGKEDERDWPRGPASSSQTQLEGESEELQQALGEATLELRVLRNYHRCKGRFA